MTNVEKSDCDFVASKDKPGPFSQVFSIWQVLESSFLPVPVAIEAVGGGALRWRWLRWRRDLRNNGPLPLSPYVLLTPS